MKNTAVATFVFALIAVNIACGGSSAQAAFPVESSSANLLTRKGYDLVQSGSYEAASVVLKNAVRANPNDLNARRYLIYALTQNGNCLDASAQLKSLAKAGSLTAVDYYLSGNNDKQQGNTDNALKQYRAALTLDPDMVAAKAGIIELFILASDFQGATFLCKDCLAHARNDAERKYFSQLMLSAQEREKAESVSVQAPEVVAPAPVSTTLQTVKPSAVLQRPQFPSILQAVPLPPPTKITPIATRAKA
ncbi:MAG TPA: tetratricopeptide repeat protein [Drouetiella sp.]